MINRPFNNSCATWVAILIHSHPSRSHRPPSLLHNERADLHIAVATALFTLDRKLNTMNSCRFPLHTNIAMFLVFLGVWIEILKGKLKCTHPHTHTFSCAEAHTLTDGLFN